jgi:DNA gyrase subunit A
VRGIRLAEGKAQDSVISLSVLRHVAASPEERAAYVKQANARRRSNGEEEAEAPAEADEAAAEDVVLSAERIAELEAAEELLLTVTDSGFGKRSSAYEYRVTGRGGQGIVGITLTQRTGRAVAGTLTVRPGDDVMLVTDAGRLIRLRSDEVKITGRGAQGVTLFRVDSGERVTSVFPVVDAGDAPEDTAADGSSAEPPASGGPRGEEGDETNG